MILEISTTPEILSLIAAGSPVAMGVSGGKDSCANAIATNSYLDGIGHTGPRVLIHSDLGRVEWKDSLPTCERLATRLGLELVVVRRPKGDMMDRWLGRWAANVERYAALLCVKLILPWSTPAMRFCTSELKTDVICRDLVRRFPGRTILSASGIRRDESTQRADAPITKPQAKLTSETHETTGRDWHPIVTWTTPEVFDFLERERFPLHEAYTAYGSDRVSCINCIMGSRAGLIASMRCPENHATTREMVGLEIRSTFAFQGNTWLGDVAAEAGILDPPTIAALSRAKERAARRQDAEKRIPKHMLYTKGWPTCVPTLDEAELLAEVRAAVAEAVGIEVDYLDAPSIVGRYRELMDEARSKAKGRSVPQPAASEFQEMLAF
jgi:3'-phosphoadenosine 5'-phosphosulfate sulfotransferase (PAPS reductase)/FAD synthetase